MTKKRILGCLRVPPVEYHCSIPHDFRSHPSSPPKVSFYRLSHVTRNPPSTMSRLCRVVPNSSSAAVVVGFVWNGTFCFCHPVYCLPGPFFPFSIPTSSQRFCTHLSSIRAACPLSPPLFGKVKLSRYLAIRALRGRGSIAPTHSWPWH
jgi:hypothetical protein